MADLDGRIALVTGGARNVGAAISRLLGERGARMLINYFHAHQQAVSLAQELRDTGIQVDLYRASVARPEHVRRMFDEIMSRIGRLDILVNNAASGALRALDDITDVDLDRAIETNYKGALRCSREAARLMRASGGGSIIVISALGSSQFVMDNYAACAPAKAAAEALARYLAVEYAPYGIRVNTASAAMLQSEVADQFPNARTVQKVIAEATPLRRLGTAGEFAELVAFLASDRSSWITGQVLLADGGLSLGAPLMSASGAPAAPQAMTT